MRDAPEKFVDRIYEAAVVPDMWKGVLGELTELGEGALASMFVVKEGIVGWVGTPAAEIVIGDFVALGRPDFNSRIPRRAALLETGFVSDSELFTPEEMRNDPFYRDFLYPRGYGWVCGTFVRPPTGEGISVSIERFFERGPFEAEAVAKLDVFGPHLARAGLLAARLGLERVRAMSDALHALGLPGAVLRAGGRLLAVNPLFEQLMPSLLQDRRDRMHLTNEFADGLFASAIGRVAQAGAPGVNSIPIAPLEERPPMILHLVPVRGAANDIFAQTACLLVVTPVDRAAVPTAEVIQGLFDLTPAEARIARGIGEARTVEALAITLGISQETVRSHLKSALRKTGLSRQQELVSLLAGKAFPRK